MIGEALDVAFTLFRAFLWWILAAAAVATFATLGFAALVAWAWRTLRRRHTGPSWAHGRIRARILARRPTRPADGRTAAHSHAPRKAHR